MPAGFTGLAGLLLIHRAAPNGPPLMLVSLVLAAATGTVVIGHFDPSTAPSAGSPPATRPPSWSVTAGPPS
ncbi:hypothetical protein [Streptosporangium roseum]|uniref:hypothetical protein n=1 Tax=Streptosporangium roseum TaxID=2001 RepID=UPI000318F1E1|nr:hypothetical protein [Streptosporangium roseum]